MKDMSFQIVQPRSDVEIHIPDGRVLSGPRGAQVGEFFKAVEFSAPVVAAIVNDDLHELTYPIEIESYVKPVTMSDPDGSLIYRRSLNFLLEVAFADLYPKAKLTIDHSISFGGYYCQVSGRKALSNEEITALRSHMQELIEADLPFERREVPLKDAIEYFRSIGYDDKVRLLAYRQKDYLTLYRFGNHMDYHHGYMVPSTGYLKWFDLYDTNGGFTLRFPRRHAPTQLEPAGTYPKLLLAFRQYGDWLNRLGIDNVGALNDAIRAGREHEIVLVSEALHEQNVAEIAQQIEEKKSHIVLIAGPSSSGKTTFSRRLTVQLLALGISPYPLELDNYFLDRDQTPLGEDGQPDFEALEAVDLKLLAEHLDKLIAGEKVQLPRYNFKTGKREAGEHLQLHHGQPIIMEGIHGLDPHLLPSTLSGRAFKIYVSALTQLNLDRHNRVSTTDTRLIRRIVRDSQERGYNAAQTISRSGISAKRREETYFSLPGKRGCDVQLGAGV